MQERSANQSCNPGQDPSIFGPQQADLEGYQELLRMADADPESIGFRPRVNAELTALRIDERSLGSFTNADVGTVGLDKITSLRITQQRYIAGVLGLQVGEANINPRDTTVSSPVSLPRADGLPPLPSRHADGTFIAASSEQMSPVQADAIYAAHFIASNDPAFSKPGAFEQLFRQVTEQAEAGQLEVRDLVGDPKGACSMVRQVARVLGYEVGDFKKDPNGLFIMPITGIRPGFDDKFTHFKG